MSNKSDLRKLTDLCCCVNAFEGYFMAYPKGAGDQVYFRQRKAMTDCIVELATKLFKAGVSLKRLDAALHNGGWDDNFFIYANDILKIECK